MPKNEGILDIEKLRRRLSPADVTEIIPEYIIRNILRGFYVSAKCRAVLVYKRDAPDSSGKVSWKNIINPFEHPQEKYKKFFNPICWEIKSYLPLGERKCDEWSYEEAEKIAAETSEDEPASNEAEVKEKYCWFGFKKLTFPIFINGEVGAVLMAGQIMPADAEKIKNIRNNIEKNLGGPHRQQAQKFVDDTNSWTKYESLMDGFREFSNAFQQLVTNNLQLIKNTALEELERISGEFLIKVKAKDWDAWYAECSKLIDEFRKLAGIENIFLYYRDRARFRIINAPHEISRKLPRQIPAYKIVPEIAGTNFKVIREDCGVARLFKHLASDKTAYYLEGDSIGERVGTFMIISGKIPENYRKTVERFCQTLAVHCNAAASSIGAISAERDLRERVSRLTHDIRTPLQSIILDLEELGNLEILKDKADLQKHLRKSYIRTFGIKEYLERLRRSVGEPREIMDLREVMDTVVEQVAPFAKARAVRVEWENSWPKPLKIRARKAQILSALVNLLDNAIKYSFKGDPNDDESNWHYVEVELREEPKGFAFVKIEDYGVGIPEDMLERILEEGYRAKIKDRKQRRPGSGLGLTIANRYIRKFGGILEINSRQTENTPPDEPNLHCLVTAKIHMPLSE